MQSHTLSPLLHGLNPAQRSAVVHDHSQNGPLLLLAGAGSGKTSVLVKRILWLLQVENCVPESILGLTFTAKAAGEMLERVQDQAGPMGQFVRLSTFHSLALRLLREHSKGVANWKRLGFRMAPVPMEHAAEGWEQNLVALGLRLERDQLFDITLSKTIQEKLMPLREQFLQTGQVVFEDLIWLAISLLEDHRDVQTEIRNRWKTVLVDEYQDINPSQYRLVRAILGDSQRLFVVGDDDQAIYGFRGADIGNIHRFQKDYSGATVLRLEWNYRSTEPIIALANRIFPNKPLALRKVLRPGNLRKDSLFQEASPVVFWESPHAGEEWAKILGTMEQLRSHYGLQWSSFAILVRYNRQGNWFRKALERASIPSGENGVQVETVHSSKGLQYPIVFYAGLAQDLTPAALEGSRKAKRQQSEEERRLFYVGVTRAEARLYLLFCKHRHWQGKMRLFRPSPYLRYMAPPLRPGFLEKRNLMLWKIFVFARQLIYMGLSMLQFVWARFVQRVEMEPWVDAKLDAWARFSLRIMSMEIKPKQVGNAASVDWSRPVFVIANHQSYADIPTVLVTLQRKLGFVAKKELGRIPFLGYWMLQIGCLMIQRGKAGVGNEVNDAIRSMPKAPNLVIFPEGTRSKNGKMGSFKSGAFRMAMDHEGIMLPLTIQGTRAGWEARKHAGAQEVVCTVLEPLDVKKLKEENPSLNHKDLMNLARKRLEEALIN